MLSSLTTMNLHGWKLLAEGAHRPASRTSINFSSGRSLDSNFLMLRLPLMACDTSMSNLQPSLRHVHQADAARRQPPLMKRGTLFHQPSSGQIHDVPLDKGVAGGQIAIFAVQGLRHVCCA